MTERSLSPLPPPLQSKQTHPPISQPSLITCHDAVKILREAILLTEGRDKVVKLLQYTSRLLLLLPSSPTKRLRPFISQMSMTRKVIKLGHGIFPYVELTKGGLRTFALVRALVEILNDFWDDVYCLSRIGLLRSPKVQRWSETWANRAWMTGIIMDVYVLIQRRSATRRTMETAQNKKFLDVGSSANDRLVRKKLSVEAYWIDVSIAKLLADLGFCGASFNDLTDSSDRCLSFERARGIPDHFWIGVCSNEVLRFPVCN